MIGEFCIVRSRDQGVVCGIVKAISNRSVEMADARQIHGWSDGANTLFEMSIRGCGTARISEPVERILILEACGVIPCTPEAEENLRESRWNAAPKSSTSSRRQKKPAAS